MKTYRNPHALRGFSLIEVLIAVIVLSVGLLALASLQINLIRSSADAKSQTVALGLAKETLEQRRTFTDLTDYEALTDVPQASATAISLGGTDYSVWQEVDRYAWHSGDGEFKAHADTGALGAGFVRNNEFKVVRVHVGWTDATGADRTVVLEDAISAIPPENSARIARKRIDSNNRRPQVIISDPSLEDGVIPIAIGDGSETAATNPRPTVVGNKGTPIKETNFDIYTYSALNDGTARAQARVETSIVGCRCSRANADASGTAFRPAFWNGTRYETPEEAPYAPPAGQLMSGNKPAVVQSDLCEACCRDHHDDETGTLGAKFSPRRASHSHFDNLTESDGAYDEACRLIRVDGFMRVAPDIYNEHFNFLQTASDFELPAPDAQAVDLYQDFVIDYLDTQFTNRSSGYNDPLTTEQAETLAAALDTPSIEVEQFQERWLHSRGLYIDYLETDAINAVNNAKSNCPDNLTQSECVLRVLPFTSINLTEVAGWFPNTGDVFDEDGNLLNDFDVLSVTQANFVESIDSGVPVRGKVLSKSAGSTFASSAISPATSGLIGDIGFAINPDEEPERIDQPFEVEGPSCGNNFSGSIAAKDTVTSVSAESCDAALQGYETTQIQLTLTLATSLGSSTITLEGPSGVSYPVASTQGTHTYYFKPGSNAEVAAGFWRLIVTSNDNGLSDTLTFNWSVGYVSGGIYTIEWLLADGTSYPFSGSPATTGPGATGDPNAQCNPDPTSANPYTCSAVSVDTATDVTFIKYNFETTADNTTVECSSANGQRTATLSCSVPVCRNFSVDSAQTDTVSGSFASSGGTDGKQSESATFRFSNISDGDRIVVRLSEGAATLPATCTFPNNVQNPTCANLTHSSPCN